MIPYFVFSSFSLGFLTFQTWGTLVAAGFLIGLIIFWQKGCQKNLPADQILNISFWIVLCSLFFARFFYVLLGGEIGLFLAKPWLFFAFWQGGMSSVGGFFGAGLVLIWFVIKRGGRGSRGKNFFAPTIWPYLESIAYAFPFGWLIGRLGCFLIHDHPGRLTNSFLGVQFPDGTRFDMALLEILAILPLAIIFLLLSQKREKLSSCHSRPAKCGGNPVKCHSYCLCLLFWYGLTRFFLDFLRASDLPNSDPRFWSLTLGQWGSLGLLMAGVMILITLRNPK